MTGLPDEPKPARWKWVRSLWRGVVVLFLLAFAWQAIQYGVRLRHEVYDATKEIRFIRNVGNAYAWGRNARADGVFNLYDAVLRGERFPNYNDLDYPPLRLMAATLWQGWTESAFPDRPKTWQSEYEFTAPMLWTDTIASMLAAMLVFVLIRMWIIRMDDAVRPPLREKRPFRGVLAGMIGALIMWLNPAAIWDGYVWVQWDIWPIPFFLAAVLLACFDWWFVAGMSLAIGACFKGQLIIASPVMLLWPLFQGRLGAAARLVAGLSFMFMMIVFPWMKPSVDAISWYGAVLLAAGMLAPLVMRSKMKKPWAIALVLVALGLAWPWRSEAHLALRVLPAAVLGMIGLARLLPARAMPHLYAFAIALLILLMIPLYHASTGWYTRGFAFGADHLKTLHMQGDYNVPALLRPIMDWPNSSMTELEIVPGKLKVRIRTALGVVYCATLLMCGFAAARHERRRDVRFLLAITLPWLLFYMMLTQMFSRYLMYGAAMAAILPAMGGGMTLLGMIIVLLGLFGIMQNHYSFATVTARELANIHHPLLSWLPQYQTLQSLEPHVGWALVLVTAIMLYMAVAPRRWFGAKRISRHG